MKTWKEEIIDILKSLNGHAYLKDIYQEFEVRNPDRVNGNYQTSIRDALEKGSKDSVKFRGEELLYMVDEINKGHYGLLNYSVDENVDLTQDDDEYVEGKAKLKKHIVRERNHKLIQDAKKMFLALNGKLFCEVCGFNFFEKYGEIGKDFIEVHHTKPVSEMRPGEKTKIDDLIMVCSNCHSMIYKKRPWQKKISYRTCLND